MALALKYFSSKERTTNTCVCGFGVIQKQVAQAGHSNLVSHIHKQHAGQDFLQKSELQTATHRPSFCSKRTLQIFSLLDVINDGFFPFSICRSKLVRKQFNVTEVFMETIMEYMESLMEIGEHKVAHALHSKFAIVLDGWSSMQIHFVCLFALLPSKKLMWMRRGFVEVFAIPGRVLDECLIFY